MLMRNAHGSSLAVVSIMAMALAACDSKIATPPRDAATAPGAGGPLAALEASPVQNEAWIAEGGQPQPLVHYARENVRLSASCRPASGPLACDAARFLRTGAAVEIPRRALDGRTSAGIKVCQRMNQPIVMMRDASGNEDSFCKFPDGSLVSNGALEQYKMNVVQ